MNPIFTIDNINKFILIDTPSINNTSSTNNILPNNEILVSIPPILLLKTLRSSIQEIQ